MVDRPWGEVMDELDTEASRMVDRKQKREFRATRPAKDVPCVIPGCAHKFRPSTQYGDFVAHYKSKHGKAA